MSRRRRVPRRVLLGLCAVVLGLAGTELSLRAWVLGSLRLPPYSEIHYLRVPHALKGWDLRPNAEAVLVDAAYTSVVSINSQGLRDVEHELGAAPRSYRVVVLGDSFMDAYQLPLNQTFPQLLQRELNGYAAEVVNLGVGGYGLTQSYLSLLEKGLRYEPDLVLLAMSPLNDVRNSSAPLQLRVSGERHIQFLLRPYADLREDGRVEIASPNPAVAVKAREAWERLEHETRPLLWRHSLTYRLLMTHLPGRESVPRGNPLIDYYPLLVSENLPSGAAATRKLWDHAGRITRRLLLKIARVAEDNGAQFGVVFIPERVQVDPQFRAQVMRAIPPPYIDIARPNRRFGGFVETQDVWLMDLLPVFMAAPSEPPLYLGATDPHWSAAGHRLAARAVAREVAERLEVRLARTRSRQPRSARLHPR